MKKLCLVIVLTSLLFIWNTIILYAGVLVGEQDGSPSYTGNNCWALKFPNGNVTANSDGTCSIGYSVIDEFSLGTAGVKFTHDSDGSLILTGLGNGFDEVLNVNLDDVENEVTFSSSSLIDTYNFVSWDDVELIITANGDTDDARFYWVSDRGDDNADTWMAEGNAATNSWILYNYISGTNVAKVTVDTTGNMTIGGGYNFADTDSNWTATTLGAALEELDDANGGGAPNQATGKINWEQLVNVPAGFADNTDDGAGGATTWDSIGNPLADGSVAFGGTTQTITGDTNDVTAITQTMISMEFTNDAATDILNQGILALINKAGANGAEYLLKLDNEDTDDAVVDGLLFPATQTITTAVNASGANITTAIAIGSNTITTGATTITSAELDRLDGLAGVIVTDTTAVTEIDGRSLTINAGTLDADAELYTDTKCIFIENPTANDDLKSIWRNSTANAFTITEIWGESDQTVTFMLQVDDGTPADVDTVDLAPAAGESEDTSLDGDTQLAASEELDLAVTSTANAPTWFSVCWTGSWDD